MFGVARALVFGPIPRTSLFPFVLLLVTCWSRCVALCMWVVCVWWAWRARLSHNQLGALRRDMFNGLKELQILQLDRCVCVCVGGEGSVCCKGGSGLH